MWSITLNQQISPWNWIYFVVEKEGFEDTKGVSRIRNLKKVRQYNDGQKKNDKKGKQRSTKHYIEQ